MSTFFKKFKKFVKNARQDRIYKEGKKLPDSPENLKTYGIPLYGIPIDDIKKTIKEIKQEPQEKKKDIKTKYASQGKVKSNKYLRHKKVLSTKKESINLGELTTFISGTLLFAGLLMIGISDYNWESQELIIPIRNQMQEEIITPPIMWELNKWELDNLDLDAMDLEKIRIIETCMFGICK